MRERESEGTMKISEISIKPNNNNGQSSSEKPSKPQFRPAQDDTKPVLQDPVLSLSLSLNLYVYLACSFHFTWVFHYVYLVQFIFLYQDRIFNIEVEYILGYFC